METTKTREFLKGRATRIEWKGEGDAGVFSAVFATLNVVDHDGDIIANGAIGDQQVVVSAYGHGSWHGALPVGKGRIYERGDEAIFEGKFFLDTQAGQETYQTVKNVGELQEYSFALPEIDYEYVDRDGERFRLLKRIKVNEVSPVLMGAGIGTRTLDIKQGKGDNETKENGAMPETKKQFAEHAEEAVETVEAVISRAKEIRNLREDQGKDSLSKAAARRLRVLKDAMVEAVAEIDDLLADPNDEAAALFDELDKE